MFAVSATAVTEHNRRPNESFWLSVNRFADLTDDEFSVRFLGFKGPAQRDAVARQLPSVRRLRAAWNNGGRIPGDYSDSQAAEADGKSTSNAVPPESVLGFTTADPLGPAAESVGSDARQLQTNPTSVDWVKAGMVGAVRDQGDCGSCWAFSAVTAVETNAAIAGLPLRDLSEQQVVDCDVDDWGCDGGDMLTGACVRARARAALLLMPLKGTCSCFLPCSHCFDCNLFTPSSLSLSLTDPRPSLSLARLAAYAYIQTAGGICGETAYPYVSGTSAVAGTCKRASCTPLVKLTGYRTITSTDAALTTAAAAGAVAVAVQADSNAFRYYSGGVLDSSTCGTSLNHAIAVVGYGTDTTTSKPYYLVRNS